MATTATLTAAVVERETQQAGPVDLKLPVGEPKEVRALLEQMEAQFIDTLPSHIPPDHLIRAALTSVRKTPKLSLCTKASFLTSLMESARLGLMPGSEDFSLVPFKNHRSNSHECQHIVQYTGYIELMYRSGQVASVECELVYEADEFEDSRGDGGRFFHKPNWRTADRGEPWLAYAYAEMLTGRRSRVIVITKSEAERIRDHESKNSTRDDSTWRTRFPQMWLKSAVRPLRKFVPTSTEIIRGGAPAIGVGRLNFNGTGGLLPIEDEPDDTVDGEVVGPRALPQGKSQQAVWPETAQPGSGAQGGGSR